MKITTLVENTTSNPKIKPKHGICFYVETKRHKILFDIGTNQLYWQNAKILGIDLAEVDILVISHGHVDHGGALKHFIENNKKAKIYIHKEAFDSHYIKVIGINFNVGIDANLKNSSRIIFIDNNFKIDEELTIFSQVETSKYIALSNRKLYMKKQSVVSKDDFAHEQCLIVTEDGRSTLFAGCSHKGIWNYTFAAQKICSSLTTCIGGFHLYNPATKKYESDELIDSLANALVESHIKYFTCHCTGKKAYKRMKNILGENLSYLSSGDCIEII